MTTSRSAVAQAAPVVHPAREQTVAGTLREIHQIWLAETREWLAPAMALEADFWDSWSAVRYLNDQFERLYRRQRAFLKAAIPQFNPPDALALRQQTLELVRGVRKLNSLGRRQGTAPAVAAACAHLVDLLEAWFGEIQRLSRRLTTAELPAQAQLALTGLRAALATRAN